jgi:cephalosporin-C deacetylase-like acetyl esterase
MRSCYLAFFAIVATILAPNHLQAAQDKPALQTNALTTGQKPAEADSKEIAENWTDLKDTKTGLVPRPAFEVQSEEQASFVRQLIRVQWRISDPIDLWVMRPKTKSRVPVILYLYGYPSETDRFRDAAWCQRATAEGFAAVGFVSALTGHRYHARPMKEWFISELAESLGSSVHDVQLILDYLAQRGDMDMERVGMIGTGSGASIAILAAQADARIRTLDLLDPWGDWPNWLRESPVVPKEERPRYIKEEFLKSAALLDPVAYLPKLATKYVRLQQTQTDPVTPDSARQHIAASAGSQVTLVKYANALEHRKAWEATGLSGWVKQQLKDASARESAAGTAK